MKLGTWIVLALTMTLIAGGCADDLGGTTTTKAEVPATEPDGSPGGGEDTCAALGAEIADRTAGDGIYNPYDVRLDPLDGVKAATISEPGRDRLEEEYEIPAENFCIGEVFEDKEPDAPDPPVPPKISPVLADWIATRDPGEPVEIIVTFRERLNIPRLPELPDGADREETNERADAIADLISMRADSQAESLDRLQELGDFEPLEQFWIVNSVAGVAVLGDVEAFAESDDVVYLQPVEGGEEPPQDANANNDPVDARVLIVSDPYFDVGLTTPWIGLLDTGVRETHDMFESPDHIAWMRDCVNGGTNCNDTSNPNFDPSDFAWDHGTQSAGVLVGNDNLGAEYRGVTEIRLDSWQIYTAAGLDSAAAIRAIENAVAAFDKVLVGEMQAAEAENGAIATAADNAYDTGAIIVAANGNAGPNAGTVRSPGIAHKVIGVGAYFVDGGAQYDAQGRGPATDGRWKPDIQAPTGSETASNQSDTALDPFGGTSGATPYAAGAAMLGRNWLHQFGTFDNGATYAFMILYGQNPWPYDHTVGAGRLEMAVNGWGYWGKVSVTDGLTIDIPINIPNGRNDFEVALWWPESAPQAHNDIDVRIVDPSGSIVDSGLSGVSVFERAEVEGALTPGTWKIRIQGYDVQTASQVVYWAAAVHT